MRIAIALIFAALATPMPATARPAVPAEAPANLPAAIAELMAPQKMIVE